MAHFRVFGYEAISVFGLVEAEDEQEAIAKALRNEWEGDTKDSDPGPGNIWPRKWTASPAHRAAEKEQS